MSENQEADNFANEGARQYLDVLATKLMTTIKEVADDEERIQLDEDGEAFLMPSVEVLAMLCERYNATPPKPSMVQQWHRKYLEMYDNRIGEMDCSEEFKVDRRKVIDRTFLWLESLSASYWAE